MEELPILFQDEMSCTNRDIALGLWIVPVIANYVTDPDGSGDVWSELQQINITAGSFGSIDSKD